MANYRAAAIAAAKRYGINPQVFLRQIQQESGFNPNAHSSAGAIGIAQFMPGTARGFGIDPHNPMASLDAAARMDAGNLKKYGSYERMLSAYNSGRPDAYKDPRFAHGQTYNYVRSILSGANVPVGNPVTGNLPSAQGGVQSDLGAFKQQVAATLLSAAANGGQFDPGSMMGLVQARQQQSAAQQTFGPGGLGPGQGMSQAGGAAGVVGSTQGLNPQFLMKVVKGAKALGATKVKITSGYRSPEHNAAVGGAKHSNHMTGHAIDGYAYVPKKGWVPLGTLFSGNAAQFGLRSGASFNWGGRPDVVHVDDGFNQH